MNPKITWWLAGLAALLFAYIYFVELPSGQSSSAMAGRPKLLPALDPSAVTRVEIIRSNQTIRAELVDDRWQLANPPYPAQSTAINVFLQTLTNLVRHGEIPAQEIIADSGGLSPFGLDPAQATLKLQAGTNLIQLRIGSKTLVGNRVYVQPASAPGIYATDIALLDRLPTSASQWRNPMLVQPEDIAFDRIALAAGSNTLTLERDNGDQLWRLATPMRLRADFARVEYVIQQLRGARIAQFVADDPKTELEAFGLQTPDAELSLALGSNTVYRIQFGKSPTNDPNLVYARVLNRSNVVLVSRELAELASKPYTEFRDRVLVTFSPKMVDRIEARIATEPPAPEPSVAAAETFVVERRDQKNWQIVEPYSAPADPQLMQLFLEDLGRLEIVQFGKEVVTDFAPYGLANPVRQYILKTGVTDAPGVTNQTLVEVDFGSAPPGEVDKVYCRRSDETSVYVVAFADMANLKRAAFALRDRRIWDFSSTNVVKASIVQRGQRRELARDPVTRSWFREDQVASAGVEETMHRLGQLQADAWIARGEDQARLLRTDGSEYQLTLTLSEQGKTRELTLNTRLSLRGQPYGAVALDGELVVFKFSPSLYALILQYLSVPSASVEL